MIYWLDYVYILFTLFMEVQCEQDPMNFSYLFANTIYLNKNDCIIFLLF